MSHAEREEGRRLVDALGAQWRRAAERITYLAVHDAELDPEAWAQLDARTRRSEQKAGALRQELLLWACSGDERAADILVVLEAINELLGRWALLSEQAA